VLKAESIGEIGDSKDRIIFGAVQIFPSKQLNLPHCALGMLVDYSGGDEDDWGWVFPVWNPDQTPYPDATGGTGGSPDPPDDALNRPLPVRQFLDLIRKYVHNFVNRGPS